MAAFQSLPGFREFSPEDFSRRQHIFRQWRKTANAYGFQEYDAPVLEPLGLYTTKSGDEIETQLFSFTDKGGRDVSLRPEMTPTVCRLVGTKAGALKRPIKWFSIAEFYRYERAQKGRLRAFHQLNADIFGEAGPEAEIELIALLIQCFTGLGLTKDDFYVLLSDRDLWLFYLEALGFNEVQARAILGAIDHYKKVGDDAFKSYAKANMELDTERKGKLLAFLGIKTLVELEETLAPFNSEKLFARLNDWRRVLDGLTMMGLAGFVSVDLGVVRGLAYYTGFVFEVFDRKGGFRALAGGGRYNDFVKKLGYTDLPAVGFAIGDVTTGLLLEQRGLMPSTANTAEIYAVIGGVEERAAAFADIQNLRAFGWHVEYPFKDIAFRKQFKAAAESGAKVALIYDNDWVSHGVVKLRNIADRSERDVARADLPAAVYALLGQK